MFAAALAFIIITVHVAEKRDCNSIQGEYTILNGCSVMTYKLGKHAFPGLPKELRNESGYQSK